MGISLSFTDLHLSPELLDAIARKGYTEPTPIQEKAIPPILMGNDIIGIAQTGTGKTASFVLPMIDILTTGRARARMPRSLILTPTRELAAQIAENFEQYAINRPISMALLIGGVAFGDQTALLEEGVHVLIATPGRLLDQFERGKVILSGIEIFVIDEADRMLDMGFIPDVERIGSLLGQQRQTLLFSATMPDKIRKLADRFMNNPRRVEVARQASSNLAIEQYIVNLDMADKGQTLCRILDESQVHSAIVFCNRKRDVGTLASTLAQKGFKAAPIHGDMSQSERLAVLDRFKQGEVEIMVASDVAARGIDIKGVSHVINYDVPIHAEDYVHRIGRTGRAGAVGTAYSFATPEDAERIAEIEKLVACEIPKVWLKGRDTAKQADHKDAGQGPRRGQRSNISRQGTRGQNTREKPARAHAERPAHPEKPVHAAKPAVQETEKPAAQEAERPDVPKQAPRRQDTLPPGQVQEDRFGDSAWQVPPFLLVSIKKKA